jgi:hypothetical protein
MARSRCRRAASIVALAVAPLTRYPCDCWEVSLEAVWVADGKRLLSYPEEEASRRAWILGQLCARYRAGPCAAA